MTRRAQRRVRYSAQLRETLTTVPPSPSWGGVGVGVTTPTTHQTISTCTESRVGILPTTPQWETERATQRACALDSEPRGCKISLGLLKTIRQLFRVNRSMDTANWIQLVAASGLGGLIVAFGQGILAFLSERRTRSFAERKAAYFGYLRALNRSRTLLQNENEHPNQWYSELKLAELTCAVVGSREVRNAIAELAAANNSHDEERRFRANEGVLTAIRKDLGISN